MSENSFRKIADESIQPQEFKFSKLNLDKAVNIKKNYPSNYPESSWRLVWSDFCLICTCSCSSRGCNWISDFNNFL